MGWAHLVRNHQEPQPSLVGAAPHQVPCSTSPYDVPTPHLSHSDNTGHQRSKRCYTLMYDVDPSSVHTTSGSDVSINHAGAISGLQGEPGPGAGGNARQTKPTHRERSRKKHATVPPQKQPTSLALQGQAHTLWYQKTLAISPSSHSSLSPTREQKSITLPGEWAGPFVGRVF